MPLVDIEVIEGVFDDAQKAQMIRKVTDAMVDVEGEGMRQVTWVRVKEVRSGQWGIGGKTPSAADIRRWQRAERRSTVHAALEVARRVAGRHAGD